MSEPSEHTWMSLVQAGVVHGPTPNTGNPESPWYVKGLLAISGWLAACFLFFFYRYRFCIHPEKRLRLIRYRNPDDWRSFCHLTVTQE